MTRYGWICALGAMLAVMGCISDDAGKPDEAVHAVDEAGTATGDGSEFGAADAGGDDEAGEGARACERVVPDPWPDADLSGPSTVGFDADLFITVNGERFFPFGFYRAPEDLEGLQAFKEEGFNIGYTGPGCCGGDSLDEQVALLETARDAGVMMILRPWSNKSDVLTRPEEDLATELDDRNDVGSLFGWYTFDEPGLDGTEKELTERMHEVLTTYDPNHPDMLVDAPLNDFSLYVDDCTIFMIDPYPSDWISLVYVKVAMEEAWEATQGTKPIIGVMQAFSWDRYHDIDDTEYHPDGADMRNMAWQFIIHGAKGLIPWNYTGDYTIHGQPDIWASYLETVAEINELKRIVLTPDTVADLEATANIPTLFDYSVKHGADADWVFTASTDDRISAASLDLSGFGDDLCVLDYTTGETFTPDDEGRVLMEYDPLQVRLLQIYPLD